MQTPERIKLGEAIAAHRESLDDVERADSRLQVANEKLAELLSRRAEYASLDDDISRARAARTIAAIEKGQSPPTEGPSGFASQLTAREQIESELASVREAIPILECDLADSKQRVAQRAYEIELAVEAVFVAEAEELASRYVEQLREVREVLYTLRFMGARHILRDPSQRRAGNSGAPLYWGSETTRAIAVPQSVLQAAHDDCLGSSEFKEGLRKRDSVSAAVSAYFAELHSDPDAKLKIAELPPAFDAGALLTQVRAEMAKTT